MTVASYLETLNDAQRRAVEHGIISGNTTAAAPLLVIAGAGSGKTNTLAHRVAHLIVSGADPCRILLMSFSRCAAAEMTRRAAEILRRVTGDRADPMAGALGSCVTMQSRSGSILPSPSMIGKIPPT